MLLNQTSASRKNRRKGQEETTNPGTKAFGDNACRNRTEAAKEKSDCEFVGFDPL